MRRGNRRWFWLLAPLVGAGAVVTSPPTDEFAALDRIGRPVPEGKGLIGTVSGMCYSGPRVGYTECGVGRQRDWDVRVPEAEARRTLDRMADRRLGWTFMGASDSGVYSNGKLDHTIHEDVWINDETQAMLSLTKEVPLPKVRGLTVTVQESPYPLSLWTKIKRRWRRATLR